MREHIQGGDLDDMIETLKSRLKAMSSRDWSIDCILVFLCFGVCGLQLMLMSQSLLVYDDFFQQISGYIDLTPPIEVFLFSFCCCLPLLARRIAPYAVMLCTGVLCAIAGAVYGDYSFSVCPIALALFSIFQRESLGRSLIAALVALLFVLMLKMPMRSDVLVILMHIQNIGFVALGCFAGYALQTYGRYMAEAAAREEEATKRQDEMVGKRVSEERLAIARDVHDITAHSLSAINIQSSACLRLIDIDKEACRESIQDIHDLSSNALDEVRWIIGALRGGDDADLTPVKGTERLPEIRDYLASAGIESEVIDQAYDKAEVPAYADIALFSVMRECATNTVRHSGAKHVSITLRSCSTEAAMVFVDDGCGFDIDSVDESQHHGVTGMRERMRAAGGSCDIRSAPGGGCTVTAVVTYRKDPHELG